MTRSAFPARYALGSPASMPFGLHEFNLRLPMPAHRGNMNSTMAGKMDPYSIWDRAAAARWPNRFRCNRKTAQKTIRIARC